MFLHFSSKACAFWALRSPFLLQGHEDIPLHFLLRAYILPFRSLIHLESSWYMVHGRNLALFPPGERARSSTAAPKQVILLTLICGTPFVRYRVPMFTSGSGSRSSILPLWSVDVCRSMLPSLPFCLPGDTVSVWLVHSVCDAELSLLSTPGTWNWKTGTQK